jgi:cytochrome P450
MELAGTVIPKDIEIAVDAAAIHLNPKIWANPNQFIPERFEEGGEHEKHGTGYTWIPFSGGSRICIGMQFSLTEQRVVLSMLCKYTYLINLPRTLNILNFTVKRYEIDISEDSEHYDGLVFDKPFNFAPKNLHLKFTRRY